MDLETIQEVGPGGNYLAEEETILRYRTEIYYPELTAWKITRTGRETEESPWNKRQKKEWKNA